MSYWFYIHVGYTFLSLYIIFNKLICCSTTIFDKNKKIYKYTIIYVYIFFIFHAEIIYFANSQYYTYRIQHIQSTNTF